MSVAGWGLVRSLKPAPDYVLTKSEDEKKSRYAQLCQVIIVDFCPFGIYGSMGSGTEHGIGRMAKFIYVRKVTFPDSERSRLLHPLSSLVIQQTAVAITRHLLHTDSPL